VEDEDVHFHPQVTVLKSVQNSASQALMSRGTQLFFQTILLKALRRTLME